MLPVQKRLDCASECQNETVLVGGLLEETIKKWKEYEEECQRRMGLDPVLDTEVYCRRTFDDYACWPDALPGATVKVPCPPYLPWREQVSTGHAYRKCTENGTWLPYLGNSSFAWRDVSECQEGEATSQEKVSVACRSAQVLLHYCSGCSYCWLLVEGLYLHALLSASALARTSCLKYYCLFGWGSPVIVVTLWVCGKFFLDNDGCWSENVHMGVWWIVRAPIVTIVLVNFIIFLKVLFHLVCTYRHQQLRFSDSRCRLAKSTLTLLPLLGVHEIVFVFTADELTSGTARALQLFLLLILNSFQGCLLSVLYCFAANEVQRELKMFWRRLWRKQAGGEEGSPSLSVVTFLGASEFSRMDPVLTPVAQNNTTNDDVHLELMSNQDPQASPATERTGD